MKLTIDLTLCETFSISPSSLVYLMLKVSKDSINFPMSEDDFKNLYENGFIDIDKNITDFGSRFIGNDTDAMFEEVLEEYPTKDGTRRLHNAKDKCRQKYRSYLRKGLDHHSVIEGIRNEKKARDYALSMGQWMPAWRALSTYINNKGWEEYLDEDNENRNIYDEDDKI